MDIQCKFEFGTAVPANTTAYSVMISDRFYNILMQFINGNNLLCADKIRLTDNSFTYCSDNDLTRSWIHHVICSNPINSLVSFVKVLYDFVSSDHCPI